MKKYTFSYILLTLILVLVFCPQTSVAQQPTNQYALYNYRNDGQFNAWLNIDVDSITYSRIDTLGVEHDDVVVQEVWTPDSLYRIPIEAIDSIGFRAPEPVYKDNIFHIRKYHMPFIQQTEGLTLSIGRGIEKDSLPAVGQIIISDVIEEPLPRGFSGRVLSIKSTQNSYVITCEAVSLTDIFERLLLVGRSESFTPEEIQQARKASPDDTDWDGIIPFEVGKFSVNIPSIEGFVSNSKSDMTLGTLSVTPKFCVSYIADIRPFVHSYVKVLFENKSKITNEMHLKVSGESPLTETKKARVYLTKVPIPLVTGVLYGEVAVSGDLALKGNIDLKATFTKNLYNGDEYEWSTSDFWNIKHTRYDKDPKKSKNGDEDDGDNQWQSDVSLSVNGSFGFGVSLDLVLFAVSENTLEISNTTTVGPELSGSLKFSSEGLEDGTLYSTLKNTNVSFTPLKLSDEVKFNLCMRDFTLGSFSKDFGKKEFKLFPEFGSLSVPSIYESTSGDYKPLGIYTKVTNDVIPIIPLKLGIGRYDKYGNLLDEYFASDFYQYEDEWDKRKLYYDISNLAKGETHTFHPLIRVWGLKALQLKAMPQTVVDIPLSMELEQTSLNLGVGQGKEVSIFKGWGDYRALNMSPDIISTQLLTHELENGSLAHGVFVEAKKSGQAFVIVQDIRSNEQVTLSVKVEKEPVQQSTIAVNTKTLDFGDMEEGEVRSEHFTVSNTGDYELKFTVGKASAPFNIPEAGKEFTLAAGGKKEFSVTCYGLTSGDGLKTQFIPITSDASNASPNFGITLKAKCGTATTSAITVSPTEINFGTVEYGTTATKELKVSNTGTQSLTFFVTYSGSSAFSINDSGREFTLNPGDFKIYTVKCTGMTQGNDATGEISVVSNAENGNQKVSVKAYGSGHVPLTLERTSIEIEVDESANVKILQGSGSYNISNSNPDIVEASLSQTNGIPCISITGLKGGTATIYVKDASTGDTKTLTVTVVFVPSTWAIDIAEISFGTVPLGTTKTAVFNVINTGDRKLTFKIGTETAPFTITDAGVTITLPKGGMKEFTVTCNGLRFGTEASVWVPIEADASNYGEFSGVGISANGGKLSYVPGEPVDLGLLSGTQWASFNMGASSPEEYGGSYAWGETDVKDSYSWSNYEHYNGNSGTCKDIGSDISGTQYDVATVKWGNGWHMPTSEQFSELESACTWEWTSLNGIMGQKVTGPNGNSIFLPAVGSGYSDGEGIGSTGYYWTSSLYDSSLACDFIFYQDFLTYVGKHERYLSHSIRPVINPEVTANTTIKVEPWGIDFGVVPKGTSKTEYFTVYNTGEGVLTFHVECGPQAYEAFEVSDINKVFKLEPGESKVFTVVCSIPEVFNISGIRAAVYIISDASNSSEYYMMNLTMTVGEVEEGKLSVTPTEIDFGAVELGTDKTGIITVTNTGGGNLTFSASSDPQFTDYFEVADNDVEFTLAPGTSKSVTVTSHGMETGWSAETNIVITSNASEEVTKVLLSAVGTDSEPLVDVSSISMHIGENQTIEVRTGRYDMINDSPDVVKLTRGGDSGGSGGGRPTQYKSSRHFSKGNIIIEALAVGTATITITDRDSGKQATLTVTVTNALPAEAVDLGLPSGTRWASCNVGATKPEEYGGKYAWGETEEKSDYTEENYLYKGQNLGSNISGTQYDVAHVKWGGNWQMPTKKQLEELESKCTAEKVVVNGVSGVNVIGPNGNVIFFPILESGWGEDFWSGTPFDDEDNAYALSVSHHGSTIYSLSRWHGYYVRPVEVSNMIPPILTVFPEDIAFGVVKYGTEKAKELTVTNTSNASLKVTMDGCTESYSNFDVSDNQEEVTLAPGESKVYTVTAHGMKAGYAPTQSLLVKCEGLDEDIEVKMSSYGDDDDPIIDVTELSLNVGETASVKVKNSGYYSSVPDDESVIELSGGGGPGAHGGPIDRHHPMNNYTESEMTVKALKAGVAHVTFTDLHTNHSSVLTVTVTGSYTNDSILVFPDGPVDMGLPSGTLWASHNVGATKPEDFGGRYAWGETEEKAEYNWATYVHCDGTAETCHDIGSDISGTEYDVAHVKWGDSWQMPTRADFLELRDHCVHQKYTLNGVSGIALTGPNGNSIFMPCNNDEYEYWTSIEHDSTHACFHGVLYNENAGMPKCTHNLVRPVKKTN